ncbi:hypothetical protein EVA_18336 [gut metagenome]|uniref:Uncharacterized protein n=1 Tax=gut metagenome TaxID=749906 RepID=J9FVH7_9ZZZZ
MSILMRLSSESKRVSAIAFASWVLPTPVGPKNMNEPIGRPGSLIPARLRLIALTTFSSLHPGRLSSGAVHPV